MVLLVDFHYAHNYMCYISWIVLGCQILVGIKNSRRVYTEIMHDWRI